VVVVVVAVAALVAWICPQYCGERLQRRKS